MLESDVLPHPIPDDGFHEIQLNGKQLVFLFMAATVVSVVIFLCGVLVGRGVRVERGSVLADASLSAAVPEPAAQQPAATPTPPGSDPTAVAPPPPVDDLSYFSRLESETPPAEALKEPPAKAPAAAERTRPAESRTPKPAPAAAKGAAVEAKSSAATPATAASASAPADIKLAEPAADTAAVAQASPQVASAGWAVQIAALTVRGDAEAIAKRLSSKGYAAYVTEPPNGTANVFRVKVGKFPTKREAEVVAAKLQKEEQFKPWITR